MSSNNNPDDVIRTNSAQYRNKINHINNLSQAVTLDRSTLYGKPKPFEAKLFERLAHPISGRYSLWNLPYLNTASPWLRSYVNISIFGLIGFAGLQYWQKNYRVVDDIVERKVMYQRPTYETDNNETTPVAPTTDNSSTL